MEASAKGAAIGLGETSVVADAATSAVNAYGSENLSGAAAVDILTAAVREGKVEATRLTPAIGKAIPVASAMGIEFHEVAAAIAAMTRTGTDARTSAIQLRQIMQSILDPSRQTTKALKEMGVAEGELATMARNSGLLAVLTKLRDLSKDNAEAFADVFPNVRALAGAMDITGENLQENTQIFAQLKNSIGDTDDAFQKVAKTGAHKLNVAVAKLKVGFTNFGESLAPLIDHIASLLAGMGKFFNFLAMNKALIGVIAGVGMLSAVSGLLLITVGRLAQSYVFLTAVLSKYAAASVVATKTTAALAVVSGVGVFLAVAAVVGVVASMALGLGKQTATSAKKLADLRMSLGDVRTAADEVIKPIEGLTKALRELEEQTDQAKLKRRFEDAFADSIDSAFDENNWGGGLQAEDAIARFFFGRGDNPAIRRALASILQDINDEIGIDSDVFLRLFGPGGTDRSDLITDFLLGTDRGLRQGIQIKAQLASDTIRHEFLPVIEKGMEQLRGEMVSRPAGVAVSLAELFMDQTVDEQDLFDFLTTQEGDINAIMNGYSFDDSSAMDDFVANAVGGSDDLLTGLRPFATEIDRFMRQHQFRDFGTMWNDFLNSVSRTSDPLVAAREIEIFGAAMMNLIGDISMFEDEITDASNVEEFMKNIVNAMSIDEGDEGRKMFSGRKMIEAFATDYVTAMGDVVTVTNIYGTSLTEAERRTMTMEIAMGKIEARVGSTAEAYDSLLKNIQGVFDEFEVAFSTADEAAKRLAERYDNLIGRTMGVTETQDDFNDGLYDMVEALEKSEGSLDKFTKAGRENRGTIRTQIDDAIEYGEALFKVGGDADQAKAGVLAALGAIHSNALKSGVDMTELDAFYKDMGVTPERLSLMFRDESDEIGDALQETMRQVAMGERGFIGPLFSGLGEEVPAGMILGIRTGKEDVLDEIEALIQGMVDTAIGPEMLDTGSPSKLFKVEVGEAIIDGIYEGIWEGVPKVTNALRMLIDSSINTVRGRMGTVTGALTSMLNLEQAEADLERITTRFGGKGIDTDFEKLTREKLRTDVKDAERALRLGQGNIHDLKLAKMEAQFTLADFEAAADNENVLEQAELKVADAGLAVVQAQIQLQMSGESAATAFEDIAAAAGLTEEAISKLLTQTGDGNSILEKFADPETLEIIRQVADGIGVIIDTDDAETDADVKKREGSMDHLEGVEGLGEGLLGTGPGASSALAAVAAEAAPSEWDMSDFVGVSTGLGGVTSHYTGNAAMNKAEIVVNMFSSGSDGRPRGEMEAEAALVAISTAVQSGVDNGILDTWRPSSAAERWAVTGGTEAGPAFGPRNAR